MKALIEKSTNLVKYIWENLEFIDENQTQADWFIFGTIWSNEFIIETIETKPDDFVWNEFTYIDWEFKRTKKSIEDKIETITNELVALNWRIKGWEELVEMWVADEDDLADIERYKTESLELINKRVELKAELKSLK